MEIHPFGFYKTDESDKLIIGSFPCFNGKDYGDWFYSGSGRNNFWKLLSEVYSMPFESLEQKEEICKQQKIAITDIAYKIERIKGNCRDSNLRILEYNRANIDNCLSNNIKHIYFTSKFVEIHFKTIYPENKISTSILLSPSPSSSLYIAGLPQYKEMKEKGLVNSTYDFRLIKYRELLAI
ncbi:MAG: hypothetical protein WCX31_14925 [Salinivirgaceae bacterium]|jgi:G:T/U-mismatch repair DNA glycosylase